MKYTIEGFNQQVLIDYGLDGHDAIILRYVVDFWHSDKMIKVIHENKEFLWINYKAVIEALPCIGIKSKIALSRRFKKYIDCGLMEHYHHTKGGSFSCYRFTKKYTPLTEKYEGVKLESKTPFNRKVKPKDSSIKDSSIKENSITVLNYLNEKTRHNYRPVNGTLSNITARLKEGYTVEDCKKVIDTMTWEWEEDEQMRKYLDYETLFRKSKFPKYLEKKKGPRKVTYIYDGGKRETKTEYPEE